MVDAARQVLLGLLLAVRLLEQRLVLERVRVGRAQPHVGLEDAVAAREVDRLHRIPLLEARGEASTGSGSTAAPLPFLSLTRCSTRPRRDAGRLVRDRRMQRVELVLHEELPVRLLDHAVADRHDLDLADRRAVAHVVEGDLRVAEELQQRRAVGDQAREHEAAVAVDARRALHAAVGVVGASCACRRSPARSGIARTLPSRWKLQAWYEQTKALPVLPFRLPQTCTPRCGQRL